MTRSRCPFCGEAILIGDGKQFDAYERVVLLPGAGDVTCVERGHIEHGCLSGNAVSREKKLGA